jgi:hypothetical protein
MPAIHCETFIPTPPEFRRGGDQTGASFLLFSGKDYLDKPVEASRTQFYVITCVNYPFRAPQQY